MTSAPDTATTATLASVREATLAEVYDLDMGRRLEDVALWHDVLRQVRPQRVVEVGCGTGRVPVALNRYAVLNEDRKVLPPLWVGMDPDPGMVERYRQATSDNGLAWCRAVCGDVRSPDAWTAVREVLGGTPDLVVIPYSTLYLLPHDQQEQALRLAGGSLRVGGWLAAEVFVPDPAMLASGESTATKRCNAPDGSRTWVRRTTYRVDGSTRSTQVERRYGPASQAGILSPGLEQFVVRERIYWRLPAELPRLAQDAGLLPQQVLREGEWRGSVPRGCAVLLARA